MSGMLSGHVALVSGAGQGIGKGIALALAGHGASVAIGVRSLDKGEAVLREMRDAGGAGKIVAMDVTKDKEVRGAVDAAVQAFGGLSIMVHNANHNVPAIAAEDIGDEIWAAQYDVALGGLFRCAKAAYPHLRASGRGRLIVLCSTFGYHGAALNANYSALKASERGFIKSIAREWGPDKVTVNAICPAALTESSLRFFSENPAIKAAYDKKYALKRMGAPKEDIGEAVAHMCSDGMGYMTGVNLFLDGGLYPGAA